MNTNSFLRIFSHIGLLFVLLTYSFLSLSETLIGKVISVKDGDTLIILTLPQNTQTKIRLAEIDAPEKNQPYGETSKKSLSDLVFNKEVTVEKQAQDKYGRTVGFIFLGLDKLNINEEQVKKGLAWVYTQYNKSGDFNQGEKLARQKKLGLWADSNPIPPWDWRKNEKSLRKISSFSPLKATAPFSCQKKKSCKQMKNCEEAKLYLSKCHHRNLDNDGDGHPCEKLCSGQFRQ